MTVETEDTYPGPNVVDDTTAGDTMGITKAVAARVLEEPGFDYAKATSWWKNTVARGLIHPYRRNVAAPRPTFLYRADQVAVAAVLHRMNEAGFAGEGLFQRAAASLNVFSALDLMTAEDFEAGKKPIFPDRNPIAWALNSYAGGARGFVFEFCAFRGKDSGALDHRGRVLQEIDGRVFTGTNWHLPQEQWTRRSIWNLQLDPILKRVAETLVA